jgi:hypothetical protein
VDGHIYWNMKSLMRNQPLDDALQTQLYTQPALVPASPWLGSGTMAGPVLTVAEAGVTRLRVTWNAAGANKPWLWLVQTRNGREWRTEILAGEKASATWTGDLPEVVAVSAVDRNGNLSAPAAVNRREK